MAVLKITAEAVADIMRSARVNKNAFYFDEDLAGFGFYRTPGDVGTWFAEFRPVAGGVKKRIKLGRVGILKASEAREAARKVIANAALGKDLAKDRASERASVSVKELAELYVARTKDKRKASTGENYEHVVRVNIVPHVGAVKAIALTRREVQSMHSKVSRERGKYAANRAVAILSAAYGWGALQAYVPEGTNPASRVERHKEEPRQRFLSPDELLRLGEALIEAETVGLPDQNSSGAKHAPKNRRTVMHPSVTGAIRLLLLTGCRLREILHLRWSEVDTDRGLLFLPDSKTGRKTVVLSDAAQAVIKGLPRIGVYVIASDSAGLKDEKPRADLKRPWASICKRANITNATPHDLRHTFGTVGAGSNLGLPVIGKLLGHTQPATTQRYAHVAVDASKRAADLIAVEFATAIGGK